MFELMGDAARLLPLLGKLSFALGDLLPLALQVAELAVQLSPQLVELVEEPLRKALDDTHWLVQKSAARSLLRLQDEELYATLETYLGDEEEDIMQAVIETSFYELLEGGDDEEED